MMNKVDRIRRFAFLSPLSEDETTSLINWLDAKGFFDAPASTKYHGAYAGGLFDHSQNVYLQLELHIDDVSAFKIAFLHDICKCDQYKATDNGYEYVKDTLLTGHGEKSVMLLYDCPVRLSEEEVTCIRYHMGAFTQKEQWSSYTNAIHKYPSVLWTHTADMIAAHIVEVNRDH